MHINQVDSLIILTERFIKRPYCYISFAFQNNRITFLFDSKIKQEMISTRLVVFGNEISFD